MLALWRSELTGVLVSLLGWGDYPIVKCANSLRLLVARSLGPFLLALMTCSLCPYSVMTKEALVDVEAASYCSTSCVGTTCKSVVGTHMRSFSGSCASCKAEVTACEETDCVGVSESLTLLT